jgi:hypothetical protein
MEFFSWPVFGRRGWFVREFRRDAARCATVISSMSSDANQDDRLLGQVQTEIFEALRSRYPNEDVGELKKKHSGLVERLEKMLLEHHRAAQEYELALSQDIERVRVGLPVKHSDPSDSD